MISIVIFLIIATFCILFIRFTDFDGKFVVGIIASFIILFLIMVNVTTRYDVPVELKITSNVMPSCKTERSSSNSSYLTKTILNFYTSSGKMYSINRSNVTIYKSADEVVKLTGYRTRFSKWFNFIALSDPNINTDLMIWPFDIKYLNQGDPTSHWYWQNCDAIMYTNSLKINN